LVDGDEFKSLPSLKNDKDQMKNDKKTKILI